jgi:hypothetical protein
MTRQKKDGARKRQRRVERKHLDLETRTLHMAFTSGEAVACPLMGLPSNVLFQLASIGVVELLSRAGDKAKAWETIKSGEVFAPKRKTYPLVVRALVELTQQATGEPLTLEQAHAKYEALSEEDRKKLRYDPTVRSTMAQLSMRQTSATDQWMSIVLGEPAATAGETQEAA